jgi:hypothetical protein
MGVKTKIVELTESAFVKKSGNHSSEFDDAVKLAMENPGKVIECEWPEGLMWSHVFAALSYAAKGYRHKLRTSCKKELRQRRVFQIMRGDSVDIAEPKPAKRVSLTEHLTT